MKRVCSTMLALLLALSLALPGFADDAVPEPEVFPAPEETETTQPEPSEDPFDQEPALPGEIPGETEPPMEGPPQEPIPAPEETPGQDETDWDAAGQDETSAPEEDEFSDEEPPAEDLSLINVTVPETGQIFINPYGLPVNTSSGTSQEQIVSEPLPITNQGNTPVSVWVSAVGSVSNLSSASFVPWPPLADARAKEIFLYAEFKDSESLWNGGYYDAENQLLITDQGSELKNVLTLDGRETGWFQLFGSTAVYPEDDWCEDDAIRVTFVFTFTSEDTYAIPLPEDEMPEGDPEMTDEPESDEPPEVADDPVQDPGPEITDDPVQNPGPEITDDTAQDTDPEVTDDPEEDPDPEVTPEPDPDPKTTNDPIPGIAPEENDQEQKGEIFHTDSIDPTIGDGQSPSLSFCT